MAAHLPLWRQPPVPYPHLSTNPPCSLRRPPLSPLTGPSTLTDSNNPYKTEYTNPHDPRRISYTLWHSLKNKPKNKKTLHLLPIQHQTENKHNKKNKNKNRKSKLRSRLFYLVLWEREVRFGFKKEKAFGKGILWSKN